MQNKIIANIVISVSGELLNTSIKNAAGYVLPEDFFNVNDTARPQHNDLKKELLKHAASFIGCPLIEFLFTEPRSFSVVRFLLNEHNTYIEKECMVLQASIKQKNSLAPTELTEALKKELIQEKAELMELLEPGKLLKKMNYLLELLCAVPPHPERRIHGAQKFIIRQENTIEILVTNDFTFFFSNKFSMPDEEPQEGIVKYFQDWLLMRSDLSLVRPIYMRYWGMRLLA